MVDHPNTLAGAAIPGTPPAPIGAQGAPAAAPPTRVSGVGPPPRGPNVPEIKPPTPGSGPTPEAKPPAPGLGVVSEETPNVSDKEQKIYDEFVNKAMEMMYEPEMLKQIIRGLQREDGLAVTAVEIVTKVEEGAGASGVPVEPDVVFAAGTEIFEQLVELAEVAGIREYTPEEIEQQSLRAMDRYRSAGPQSPERSQDAKRDFSQMVDDSQSGQMARDLPELAARVGGAPTNG